MKKSLISSVYRYIPIAVEHVKHKWMTFGSETLKKQFLGLI